MTAWQLEITTALRVAGFVYVALPLAVWWVLRGKHPAVNLACWCGGALCFGLGNMISGSRAALPAWMEVGVSSLMVVASYYVRVGALELEMDRQPRWRVKFALILLTICIYLLAASISLQARQLCYFTLHLLGLAWLSATAVQVWRVTGLPSSRLIAAGYSAFFVIGVVAVVETVSNNADLRISGDNPATVVGVAVSLVAGLLGSVGYVGIAMEKAYRLDLLRERELERESAQRSALQQHASQLQSWLDEREELIRLLAHFMCQPLNNAMAALHATHRALGAKDLDFGAVSNRVRRAEGVLGQITGALDNTLAATALLASPDRVEPRDVDVDTVTALSIGDLSPELRKRVQVHRVSQVRTATMDAGLMRLALRNLLSNAGSYTPANTPIVLRVTDTEDPLGLVFAVIDQGPGIPPELASRLFERGVRGQRDGGGHGLGLYVVRRVMELHGGTVDVGANPGGGAIFRLTLPQTDDAYSSPMPFDALGPPDTVGRAA